MRHIAAAHPQGCLPWHKRQRRTKGDALIDPAVTLHQIERNPLLLRVDVIENGVDETWWKAFGDPLLEQLAAQVTVNNQNLKVAEAQYRAARATLAGASAFPAVSLAATQTRSASLGMASRRLQAAVQLYKMPADAGWRRLRLEQQRDLMPGKPGFSCQGILDN